MEIFILNVSKQEGDSQTLKMTVRNNMLQLFDLVTMFILCYNWHICSTA